MRIVVSKLSSSRRDISLEVAGELLELSELIDFDTSAGEREDVLVLPTVGKGDRGKLRSFRAGTQNGSVLSS